MTVEAAPEADSADPAAVGAGPVAVLAEAMTLAAGSSRLLRRASIYIGLLMLALAGPGVVAGLALLGAVDLFEPTTTISEELAGEAGRAAILILIALVGAIVATVEGTAIGITLLAGRVLDRPISLAAALERSRKVFWRIIRAGILIGLLESAASVVWGLATGSVRLDDPSDISNQPIAAAIATLPFVYTTVAIVLADDGVGAALRRSARIARHNWRLTVALGAFALLAGVVQTFALGSGLDLITRLTSALNLDITAGGLSFLLAGALALAVVMAAGSLLFTVTALVNAPQVVAWRRLGLPVDGLPAVPAPAPAIEAPAAAAVTAEPEPAFAVDLAPEPVAAPETAPAIAPASAMAGEPAAAPATAGWAAPPAPAPSAWATAAAVERPFRWVTWPMRVTVICMWLIAAVSLLADRGA